MSDQRGSEGLQAISPLDAVRRVGRPLFRTGEFNPVEATGLVVEGALLCGVAELGVRIVQGWVVIFGETDWLIEDGRNVSRAAFERIQSFQPGGVNSMRPEVLLTAFAPDVFTVSSNEVWDITGSCQDFIEDHPELPTLGARVIGFRAATLPRDLERDSG